MVPEQIAMVMPASSNTGCTGWQPKAAHAGTTAGRNISAAQQGHARMPHKANWPSRSLLAIWRLAQQDVHMRIRRAADGPVEAILQAEEAAYVC